MGSGFYWSLHRADAAHVAVGTSPFSREFFLGALLRGASASHASTNRVYEEYDRTGGRRSARGQAVHRWRLQPVSAIQQRCGMLAYLTSPVHSKRISKQPQSRFLV